MQPIRGRQLEEVVAARKAGKDLKEVAPQPLPVVEAPPKPVDKNQDNDDEDDDDGFYVYDVSVEEEDYVKPVIYFCNQFSPFFVVILKPCFFSNQK